MSGHGESDVSDKPPPHDHIPTGVPDIDDPIYGERAAIGAIVPDLRGAQQLLSSVSDTPGGPTDTFDGGADYDNVLPEASADVDAPKERPAPAFTIDFLKDGDVEAARRVSQFINDPRNRKAFVSPYPTVEEDPNCEAIFREVKKPNTKIALFRDSDGIIRGHAQLSLHPDRADMVTWYLGVLDPDIQDQKIGPIFIQALADATFAAEWPADRDGNPRSINLIEMHVILNEKNHPKDFSNVTREQFPHAYRLLRKLSDFVDETAYYPPYIKTVLEDGRVIRLPVAVFTILFENYDAYRKLKAKGDLGQ